MIRSLFLKCIFIFYAIIAFCPRKTNLTFSPTNIAEKTYHQSAINPKIKSLKITPHLYLLRDQKVIFFDDVDEPGFDFTENEMKKFKIWPKGVIPYYIDVLSFSDKVLRDTIRNFLNTVNAATSLNFVELPSPPKDDKTRWVFFVNRRGQMKCADPHIKDFTNEGVQKVVLGYECLSNGGALAESVLSLVGVPAQHNAPDRDNYIKVNWENVVPDKKYLFTKLKDDEWLFHDVTYDFKSASHYDFYRNSANGRAAIEVLDLSPDILVGEPATLSSNDILKIRMLYNYISKKKTDLPECHKLFETGVNFNKIKPKKDIIEPRKKHNKYLGITVDKVEEKEDDIVNNGSTDKEDPNIKGVETLQGSLSNDDLEQEEKGKSLSTKKKLYLPNKRGPLDELSDFNTDEEYRKLKEEKRIQKLKFKPVNW
ncbi:hypothetical protein K1T71_002358 [Dendrolimus kikuchii]|uniref:Uncharacterized protein n=1 Tax=Dendrolimus kikuchii TaxID=765133 RepID=A0ACC1DDG1_9NEOP|nr:hypothetical protein K1T71_002358 [Dendrolimus kikuchii]